MQNHPILFAVIYDREYRHSKLPRGGDDVLRVQPPRVIDIDVGQANHAFLVNEKGGRHRQVLRALRTVEQVERMAEPAIKLLQVIAELENEAKLAGHLVARIAQYGKSEFVLFLGAQGVVRQLRRDGYELDTKRADARLALRCIGSSPLVPRLPPRGRLPDTLDSGLHPLSVQQVTFEQRLGPLQG